MAFHQSKSVASWARDSLRKCEAEIQLEGMAEFEPILLDLFTHLVSSSSNTISTTATTDGEGQRFFFGKTLLKELFKSLGSIIASMSTDAIQTGLFAIMPELFRMFQSRLADDSAAVEAARSSQNEQGKSTTHFSNSIFPAVVTCMYFLAKKCPGVFQVSSQSESLLLCSTIASHPLFHQTLSSQAVGAAQNADNHVSTTLYWLRIHISSRPDIFDSLLLDVIGEQCLSHLHSTWDPLARVHLFTKILAPLLSSPNELFDRVSLGAKDVLFSLIIGLFDHEIHQSSLILPYSEVLQSETISRIKDCLIKSMSNLNIYFKRIHSSSSSTSSSSASANCDLDNNNCNNSFSVYLYHYTWSALVASKSFKIHLQNTVMSGYSQIGMIDEILPESSSSSIVPLYNTTLSSIRLVIADYLQKIGELDQSEIFAFVSKYKDDIPLWMVCPIEACSVSATKILLKMTDCEFL